MELSLPRGRRLSSGSIAWALGVVHLMLAASVGGAVAQERWRLAADPTLELGLTDGPDQLVFHDLRGASVVGTQVVIADGGSGELRIFDHSGAYVRSFGRLGDGPKEFRRIAWMDMCGGADIVVWDSRRNRITKWGVDGDLREEFSIDSPNSEMPPYRVACNLTGDFVVMAWPTAVTARRAQGPYRPPVAVGLTDARGQLEKVLGYFPGPERLRTEHNDRPHPFGRETFISLGPAGAYVGTADSSNIVMVRSDGERVGLPEVMAGARLSEEMRERWVDHYLARAPEEQRSSLRRSLLRSPWVPDVTPAYSGFQRDRLGNLWVAPYVVGVTSDTIPAEWVVFHPDGHPMARVVIPSNFRPADIGADYVLGVAVDSMGVETVMQYGLTR